MKRTSRCSKDYLSLRSSLRHASNRASLKVDRSGIWGWLTALLTPCYGSGTQIRRSLLMSAANRAAQGSHELIQTWRTARVCACGGNRMVRPIRHRSFWRSMRLRRSTRGGANGHRRLPYGSANSIQPRVAFPWNLGRSCDSACRNSQGIGIHKIKMQLPTHRTVRS